MINHPSLRCRKRGYRQPQCETQMHIDYAAAVATHGPALVVNAARITYNGGVSTHLSHKASNEIRMRLATSGYNPASTLRVRGNSAPLLATWFNVSGMPKAGHGVTARDQYDLADKVQHLTEIIEEMSAFERSTSAHEAHPSHGCAWRRAEA